MPPAAPAATPPIAGKKPDDPEEQLVRVEAVKDGTYPAYDDPSREPWYAIPRRGRVVADGKVHPGEVFLMKRKHVESAIASPGNPFGWVRQLKDGELAQETEAERPVPMTTDPRMRRFARR